MGLAWVGLCLALAVHVTDEALGGGVPARGGVLALESGDLPARIRAEHERVTKVAQEIRAIIGAATPDERTPQWRLALLQLLRDLANELVEHFQLEEEGGFMSEVLSRLPQKARIVQGLEREHAEITRRLDKVVIDVEAARQGNDSDVLDIRRQTTAVLSLLDDHEAAESALIQEAYLQDEGGSD